ncbi:MAG: hypothetical protein ABIB55_02675 [Candidatus Nealsonbacteria bacterium]
MILFLLFVLAVLIGVACYLFIFKKKKSMLPMKTPIPPETPIA